MEESNSVICDSIVDESDYDQFDTNTAIGRANCTVWFNEHPRRNVHQSVPCERAGVHVTVPTHSVSATFSFFFMAEMQEIIIQATSQKEHLSTVIKK